MIPFGLTRMLGAVVQRGFWDGSSRGGAAFVIWNSDSAFVAAGGCSLDHGIFLF